LSELAIAEGDAVTLQNALHWAARSLNFSDLVAPQRLLDSAFQNTRPGMVTIVLDHVPIDRRQFLLSHVRTAAIENDSLEFFNLTITDVRPSQENNRESRPLGDKESSGLLRLATKRGCLETVERLLELNASNRTGALHIARKQEANARLTQADRDRYKAVGDAIQNDLNRGERHGFRAAMTKVGDRIKRFGPRPGPSGSDPGP
jgi:ankyrin repeat protein